MTITVTSIIAVPLSLLITQHVESLFESRDRTMAVNLARFEMERVNNLSYANIVSDSFPNYQGYNYDVARTVVFVQGGMFSPESLKQVTVQVSEHGSGTILVNAVTYIARNVVYGI